MNIIIIHHHISSSSSLPSVCPVSYPSVLSRASSARQAHVQSAISAILSACDVRLSDTAEPQTLPSEVLPVTSGKNVAAKICQGQISGWKIPEWKLWEISVWKMCNAFARMHNSTLQFHSHTNFHVKKSKQERLYSDHNWCVKLRLPQRNAATLAAAQHHRPLGSIKLHCLATEYYTSHSYKEHVW